MLASLINTAAAAFGSSKDDLIAARQLIAKHARTFRNPKSAWMLWSSHIRRVVPSFQTAL